MSVERNVVFGMYSGLALLLDVHRSEKPNGYGVLFVAGSGWQAPLGWDAAGLKDKEAQVRAWVTPLVRAGYTVFAVNHRAVPRFRYPAALEDVQRALRFLRRNCGAWGIDAARLGAVAGSSGAHLACLAAMLGAPGTAGDGDPVNRESAALQCAVLRAPPTDLRRMAEDADGEGRQYVLSFVDEALYAAASPITHVSNAAPPVLLIHGDADSIVPFAQSLAMEAALRAAGVCVRLIRIPGGAHGCDFGSQGAPRPGWPDYLGETVSWLDRHLAGRDAAAGASAPGQP